MNPFLVKSGENVFLFLGSLSKPKVLVWVMGNFTLLKGQFEVCSSEEKHSLDGQTVPSRYYIYNSII